MQKSSKASGNDNNEDAEEFKNDFFFLHHFWKNDSMLLHVGGLPGTLLFLFFVCCDGPGVDG